MRGHHDRVLELLRQAHKVGEDGVLRWEFEAAGVQGAWVHIESLRYEGLRIAQSPTRDERGRSDTLYTLRGESS